MSYLNATHACPVKQTCHATNGQAFSWIEWVEPVIFATIKPIEGRETYWYVNAVTGEAFYDYEPLPVWGAL